MAALVGQATNASDVAVTSLVVTRTTTAGNLLVLCMAWGAGATVNASVADTASNTWVGGLAVVSGAKSGSVKTRTEIWYVLAAASITSVTITIPSFVIAANLSEWSGLASFDTGSASTVGGTSTTPTTPTITPAAAGELIIASQNNASAGQATSTYGNALTAAGGVAGDWCVPRYTLAGTTSESATWTITSAVWGACIAAFVPSAVPQVPFTRPMYPLMGR